MPALFALFLAAFAFGTTEFVIAGILPDVASGLSVSVPTAGYLVSGYALGVAIGGPLLTISTARIRRKPLILGLLIVFIAGQLACALAPDFASMLAFRAATAIAHGTFFGVAMVVATGLVPPTRRGMAIALILAGLTVSTVIGVPVGAAIGASFGWRATFWAMLALGIVAALALIALLPANVGPAHTPGGLGREVRVLGRQQVWTCLILMLLLMIGQMLPFTYIAPLLGQVTGLTASQIPWVLLLIGVGSTIGVFLGGRIADWSLMPGLITLLAIQTLTLFVMYMVSATPTAMIGVLIVWGAMNFAIGAPIQTRIITWTADAPNLAAALIPSGFNIGIALAASLGAVLLDGGMAYATIPLIGAAALLVATSVAALSYWVELRAGRIPPAPLAQPA